MATSSFQTLRLVTKTRYDEQHFVTIPPLTSPLAPNSVRIQPALVALTSNNLAYCAASTFLHWWDCFPLPPTTPPPFSNKVEYGIAPGWGYGTVQDSTISSLEPGTVISGFIPISSHVFDLELTQSPNISDHWIETSKFRSEVMPMYQRYQSFPPGSIPEAGVRSDTVKLYAPIFKVWEAGYVLNKYIFPTAPISPPTTAENDSDQAIHPFGLPTLPWSEAQSDLSSALLINIAAGTKTCRAFMHQISTARARSYLPAAVFEITGSELPDSTLSSLKALPLKHKIFSYAELSNPESMSLPGDIARRITKIVILDFGGRDGAVADVCEQVSDVYSGLPITVLSIGGESKVYTPEELAARRDRASRLQAVQMNTSGVRDEAIRRMGEKEYFEALDGAFEKLVAGELSEADDDGVLGVHARTVAGGMRGDDGVEGFWRKLCTGQIAGDDGVLVRLDLGK